MIKGNIRETAKLNANKKYETKHTKEIYNREYHEESDVYIYIFIYIAYYILKQESHVHIGFISTFAKNV